MSEGAPPPIETRMDYSAEDVRGLVEFVDKLAERIADAVDLARSARSDLENGWDDDTGAKARASLTVGADQAEELGEKAVSFANTLRAYVGILSRANEHLEDARETGQGYMDGTQMPFPDDPSAMQYREVPETGDPRQLAEIAGAIAHRDTYMEVHDHVEDAKRTLRETELEDALEGLKNAGFFTGLSFVNGSIEQVARGYNARFLSNADIRASSILNWPAQTPTDRVFNQRLAGQQQAFAVQRTRGNPADLVAKISRSWATHGITVFGIAFEIYNGVEPEKAIFTGLAGGAAGAAAAGLFGPAGWTAVLAGGFGGMAASWGAGWAWDNMMPDTVKEDLAETRERFQREQQRIHSEREWGEEYREERDRQWPGRDLKGP